MTNTLVTQLDARLVLLIVVTGAPMPGAVVEVKVTSGEFVDANTPCVVLNAMKMETVVVAPKQGVIDKVHVQVGDTIDAGDLLVELTYKDSDKKNADDS